jgi:cyclopropane fatty-acyl-phospholipid synthase-like methyltransferase
MSQGESAPRHEAETGAHTEAVRRYYDDNSARFERHGQGGASIHRAVWGPGVTTRAAAFHHVEELILQSVQALGPAPRVVDLGCGAGASLLYLADHHPGLRGDGITISPVQAARADTLIAQAGLGGRVRCREGNFLAVPDDLVGADLAFSIEAFVHSPDAAGYLREAARVLRPGGRLLICDDFLATAAPLGPQQARWIERFRAGWRVGSLLTTAELRQLAPGFTPVRDLDLTPFLELGRPRDRLIAALVAASRLWEPRGEYWRSLVGGDGLQKGLRGGVLCYRLVELERAG